MVYHPSVVFQSHQRNDIPHHKHLGITIKYRNDIPHHKHLGITIKSDLN